MSTGHLFDLLLSHLLSIVGFLMGFVLVASILASRRAPGTTYAWLLAIVLIPYVGVPLYLVLGGRKLRKGQIKQALYASPQPGAQRGTIAEMMCASGAPPIRTANQIDLHLTGEVAYAAVVETLSSAQRSIHISTLILGNDEVGHALVDLLIAKARAGLEVRVLLDAMFKFRADRRRLAALRDAGAKFAWFNPVWHVPFRAHANLRLHRKIIVVDGHTAIVGGMNLATEYMGPTPSPTRWRDLSLRVVGGAVEDIDAVFRADWHHAAHEELAVKDVAVTDGHAEIQVVGSGPDVANDLLYDAFLSAVFEARHRLWIATPYFVPDEALVRGLVLAVRRGVDVRIIVPARSNHRTADFAGASYLRQVAEAGGTICCYRPGMMHAKSILVDNVFAVIGSANLDMRSLFLNFEISLFFTSRAEIEALAGWFESMWPACGPLAPAGRARMTIEALARLIGPLE